MINYFKKLFRFFRPRTAKGVVEDIFDKIDQLEVISEQQEVIFEQLDAQVNDLLKQQMAAVHEGEYAERVAAKLRSIVTVEDDGEF